jgi:hypothetical protein
VKKILQSPLNADTAKGFQDNFRFLLWCARAETLAGHDVTASHMVCPWFLDDTDPAERERGYSNSWFAERALHSFYVDRGNSSGMKRWMNKSINEELPFEVKSLAVERPDFWAAFQRGEWPPHTPGFEIAALPADGGNGG